MFTTKIQEVNTMTSFALRLLAIIAMLIDHTAAVLVDPGSDLYTLMRIIGRIAFPIFCFLIVEGFEHTRSVGKYIGRMALFSVAAEIPYDLAFHNEPLEFTIGQNVFLTLLFGLVSITTAGKGVPWILKRLFPDFSHTDNRWIQILLASPVIALFAWLADSISTDYGWFGVVTICIFYLLHDNRALALTAFGLFNSFRYGIKFLPDDSSYALFAFRVYLLPVTQWFAAFATLPLGFYNGEPGSRKFRNLFYVFYPAHLFILWLISIVIK